ncbi:SDR family NAD(P)-dependent oxidoreductase [Curtobacterium sp. MCSS17_015]|uniref:SDR family NAD(P)-dependent oxidoreductase n=1 Tax=Curtobacterium sp. MCSS17_015 TaxID=2175666 RepID=UPI000DAA3B63|nr:SDR family NAD(P)-dependent oxidoreductase [Curtobacterium sp. MCSS17_015]WIB26850.1 SDR family NAD(P)-dependent oxidoreductase [Curtobacterium sp. MCSS17_015]
MFTDINPPDRTEFAGKRAVVTGGSRGRGAAITRRLRDGGATVVVTARSATGETPDGATFIPGDISTVDGVEGFATAALDASGRVDILVDNAGAARVHPEGIAGIPDEEWVDSVDINHLSAVRVTSAFLPSLHDAGAGAAVSRHPLRPDCAVPDLPAAPPA